MVALNFAKGSHPGKNSQVSATRLINGYVEEQEDGKSPMPVYACPGLRRWDNVSLPGPFRGAISVRKKGLYVVSGDYLYKFAGNQNDNENTIPENALAGTPAGITAYADDGSDSVTYSLSNNAGRFQIDGSTGVVTVASGASFDAETATSHTITVIATSSDTSTSTRDFVINISDVDEFDVGAVTDSDASGSTVPENIPIGTEVGITAFAVDQDVSDDVSYSFGFDGNGDLILDNGQFSIDPESGIIKIAATLEYEVQSSHVLQVWASSPDGSKSSANFTVTVTDYDQEDDVDFPYDNAPTTNAIPENAVAGTFTGIAALANEPTKADEANNQEADTVTYSLTNNAGGRFTIDSDSGEVTVATGASFDREAIDKHTIEIRATSSDGSTSSREFEIEITDIDEFDISVLSDSDSSPNLISETALPGTVVGITAHATDADATDDVTYRLIDDAGLFGINSSTGVVSLVGALDYETATSHTIEVEAVSGDGTEVSQTYIIQVTNKDEGQVGEIVDLDNSVKLGRVTGAGLVHMASNMKTNPEIAIVNNLGEYFLIDTETDKITLQRNDNLPTPISVTFLDGYFVFGVEDGRIFHSSLNDGKSINALAFGNAESVADGLKLVIAHRGGIVCLGDESLEVWENVGTEPFAFQPIRADVDIGCVSSHTAVEAGNGLVWVDQYDNVKFMPGSNPLTISNHDVSRAIQDLSDAEKKDLRAIVYNFEGHEFYSLSSDQWTWEWDSVTKEWHERKSLGRDNWIAQGHVFHDGKELIGSHVDGNIYYIDPIWHKDGDERFVFDAYAPVVHSFPNRVIFDALEIDALMSDGYVEELNQILMMRYSDDGGISWSNERHYNLDGVTKHSRNIRFNRLGMTYEGGRIFHISVSAAICRGLLNVDAAIRHVKR